MEQSNLELIYNCIRTLEKSQQLIRKVQESYKYASHMLRLYLDKLDAEDEAESTQQIKVETTNTCDNTYSNDEHNIAPPSTVFSSTINKIQHSTANEECHVNNEYKFNSVNDAVFDDATEGHVQALNLKKDKRKYDVIMANEDAIHNKWKRRRGTNANTTRFYFKEYDASQAAHNVILKGVVEHQDEHYELQTIVLVKQLIYTWFGIHADINFALRAAAGFPRQILVGFKDRRTKNLIMANQSKLALLRKYQNIYIEHDNRVPLQPKSKPKIPHPNRHFKRKSY